MSMRLVNAQLVHMEMIMVKVLIPVDGSENSIRVARNVVKLAGESIVPLDIHLLNVQHPLPGTIKGVAEQAKLFHNEQSHAALAGAQKILDDAGVKHTDHMAVGEVDTVVVHLVDELKCDQVIMGTRGMNSIANMVLGSVATKVLHLVQVPVTFIK